MRYARQSSRQHRSKKIGVRDHWKPRRIYPMWKLGNFGLAQAYWVCARITLCTMCKKLQIDDHIFSIIYSIRVESIATHGDGLSGWYYIVPIIFYDGGSPRVGRSLAALFRLSLAAHLFAGGHWEMKPATAHKSRKSYSGCPRRSSAADYCWR